MQIFLQRTEKCNKWVEDAENGRKEEVEGEEDGKAVSQSRYPMLSFPLSC